MIYPNPVFLIYTKYWTLPFFLRIDNASSKRSREAPRQWCRVGCEKRVLSIFGKHAQEEIGISLSVLNNYFSKLEESDEPIYKNKKCSIRKGTLYVKPTTRGVRSRGIRLLTIQVSFVYISCKVFVCINISPNAIFQHFNPPQYNRNEYTFIFCW